MGGMGDAFEALSFLPADDDYARLRAMVCDPGTIYAYWQAGQWLGDGWRVRVLDSNDVVIHQVELDVDERQVWAYPAPNTRGRLLLDTRRKGRWETAAEVPFQTPRDRPPKAPPAAEPVWARPVTGPVTEFTPQDQPELEDVVTMARKYHGQVWTEPEVIDHE